MHNIDLFRDKIDCCGCEACVDICPAKVISLSEDDEGFYYPVIKDVSACIECKKCQIVCPVKNVEETNMRFFSAYAGWCKEESEVVSSSSGGFASALAKKVLEENGIVYGVAFSEDCYSAEYIRVENTNELLALKSSKYITTHKNGLYKKVLFDIKAGYKVLVIGLPCEIYAMNRFIGHSNLLITVSLICHGPTSEIFHKAFLSDLESIHQSKVNSVSLRFKKNNNWKPYYIQAKYTDGSISLHRFEYSDYNTVFQFFKRPSCHHCKFKNTHFSGDLLIGDFHVAQKGQESYHRSGVSSILPLTSKGEDILASLKERFVYYPVNLHNSTSQKAIHSPVDSLIDRNDFIREFKSNGLSSACKLNDIKKLLAQRQRQRRRMRIKSLGYRFLHLLRLK